jgi:hypothetical protein
MRGTQEEWMSQNWQATLSTPNAMVAHFCPIIRKEDGTFEVIPPHFCPRLYQRPYTKAAVMYESMHAGSICNSLEKSKSLIGLSS